MATRLRELRRVYLEDPAREHEFQRALQACLARAEEAARSGHPSTTCKMFSPFNRDRAVAELRQQGFRANPSIHSTWAVYVNWE